MTHRICILSYGDLVDNRNNSYSSFGSMQLLSAFFSDVNISTAFLEYALF